MSAITLSDRVLGALWGAVAGDALGVPVEFMGRADVQRNPVTGMRGYGTHRQPPGTWSDDSSLMLSTVESLAERCQYDPADLAQRFINWERVGVWTPHGSVFDIGIATSQAIGRLDAGVDPESAGGADEYDNGNGSLMRILPMGLWFHASPIPTLVDYAQRASCLTHRHPRSQMACALYCLLLRELLLGVEPEDAYRCALKAFASTYENHPFSAERLHFRKLEEGRLAREPESAIDSSGYVMHTLTASLWCLLTSRSFTETVLKAVNLGGDTDTTGTVAGGLAGAYYGLDAVPAEWRRALARHGELETLFASFAGRILAAGE